MGMQLPLTETEIYLVINFASVTSINNLNAKDVNILSRFWIFFFFFTIHLLTPRNEIYSPVVLLQVCCISKMCVIERYKHFDPNQVCTCPLFF